MGNLFNLEDKQDILDRVSKIEVETLSLWGKMNAHEMLCHVADPIRDILGLREVKSSVPGVIKPFMKAILLSKSPFGRNMPTIKVYKQGSKGLGTRPTNFQYDKAAFKDLINRFSSTGESYSFREHGGAGRLKREEHGYLLWKHTDHHLRQFGV